jgi:hypothetical protein
MLRISSETGGKLACRRDWLPHSHGCEARVAAAAAAPHNEISGGLFIGRPLERNVRLLESFSYPCRVSSAIQNSVDSYLVRLSTIIDGERKPLGEKTVVPPKMYAMYSRKQPKRLDIRKWGFQEIATYARFL